MMYQRLLVPPSCFLLFVVFCSDSRHIIVVGLVSGHRATKCGLFPDLDARSVMPETGRRVVLTIEYVFRPLAGRADERCSLSKRVDNSLGR